MNHLHKIALIFISQNITLYIYVSFTQDCIDIYFTEYTLHQIFRRSAKRYEEAVEGRPNGEICQLCLKRNPYLTCRHMAILSFKQTVTMSH